MHTCSTKSLGTRVRKGTETLTSMQEFLSLVHPTNTKKSNVGYLKVMNAVADSEILQSLKHAYGSELKKLPNSFIETIL